MSELKKPFTESKDALWKKLYAELGGEFRFSPMGDQDISVEVQYDSWALKLAKEQMEEHTK